MSGFTDVDLTADPRSFVRYLDQARSTDEIRAAKLRTFDILNARRGSHVLDVGCGTGDDVMALARRVGGSGLAVGVDSSKTMIAEARRRARGLSLPVEFRRCDAHRLCFQNDTFDGCFAERVFMHLEHPGRALSEMIRVARSGARIIVNEPGWETLVMEAGDQTVTRGIVKLIKDSFRHSGVGHQLPVLFAELGLRAVTVETGTLLLREFAQADLAWRITEKVNGVLSSGQAARWLSCLEEASQAGRFFAAVTGFLVAGKKP
jgi:ubiquinone/menaquinone biosynthesis C-methylase UbiE